MSGWLRKAVTWKEDGGDSFQQKTWADPAAESIGPVGNRYWAQYALLVDLYKHYLDIAWKASVWYYAVTGAILTYYLANRAAYLPGPMPLVLLFLAVVSGGFAALHVKGAYNMSQMRELLEGIALKLGLPGRPHVEFAIFFLLLSALLMTLVCIASIWLFVAEYQQFEFTDLTDQDPRRPDAG